jgi:hypothetical protein
MARKGDGEFLPVRFISDNQLIPGLRFCYQVRAEKGFFGDFPGRFPFELHGRWAVAAAINEASETGHQANFQIFENEEKEELLLSVEGIILPRPRIVGLAAQQFGEHPLQEGYSTLIIPLAVNGLAPAIESLQKQIPARNIEAGTLKVSQNH